MSKQKAKTSKKIASKLKEDELDKVEGGAIETFEETNQTGVIYNQGSDLQQKVRLPTGVRKGKVY